MSTITFKESPLGAEHAFRIQRASFFNEIESEMLFLTIKFSNFFEYRSDYVKNKQIADEFDPTFKNKQCRRIRPFLRHQTKRVEFVGMPTNSPPLRFFSFLGEIGHAQIELGRILRCFLVLKNKKKYSLFFLFSFFPKIGRLSPLGKLLIWSAKINPQTTVAVRQ